MIISCVMLHWNNQAASGVRSKAVGMVFITMIDLNLAAYSIILSLLGQNIAGTTKKQVTMVITFIFCACCLLFYPRSSPPSRGSNSSRQPSADVLCADCLANICIPQSFLSSQAPHYQTGLVTVLCTQIAYIIICVAWYLMVRMENRKRDKAQAQQGTIGPVTAEETRARIIAGLQDETDKRNPYFRYIG